MGSLVAEPQAELGTRQPWQAFIAAADGQVEHQLVLPVQQGGTLAFLLGPLVLRNRE